MGIVQESFKRLHYPTEIILLCLRWYLSYSLSLRNLEEMMLERGIIVDHSTIHRWILRLSPLLTKNAHKRRILYGGSWYIDETYIKIKGKWHYLYRAVNASGHTIDFMLSKRRDKRSAKRFFSKAMEKNLCISTLISIKRC
ncbi:Transposase for insertion sequence-like element IS431mec [Wohlfahrtiimonas chitiniclastica]|nr:IS6 family transposase [Wohlfahrtiimonas chitiniclastica]KZS22181.1 Transposase for insertion sequence-like element IS431mec [Wohlfahrtiimonas chitiniclastica]